MAKLEAVIEPDYPQAGGDRRPYLLSTMPRIHFLQKGYALGAATMEEELCEIASMRKLAGLSPARGSAPHETTILNFRHLWTDLHGALEVAAESDDAAKKSNRKFMAAYFIAADAVRRGDRQRACQQARRSPR